MRPYRTLASVERVKRRYLARPARDQAGGHHDEPLRRLEPASRANSSSPARRPSAYGSWATTVMPGLDEVAEHDVVESDERDLALQAELAQRPDRADRDQVLAGEQRRRRVRAEQQLARRGARGLAVGELGPLERGVGGDAGRRRAPRGSRRGARSAVKTPTAGRRGRRSGGGPAAIRCSTADARAAGVVAHDGVAGHEARRAVDEHERGARLLVAQQVALVAARRGRSPARRRRARRTPRPSSRSRSGSSSEEPTNVSTPRGGATSSTPRWTAEKNGFETSSMISPMLADCAVGAPQGARRQVAPVAEQLPPRHARARPARAAPRRCRSPRGRRSPGSRPPTRATSFIVGRARRGRQTFPRFSQYSPTSTGTCQLRIRFLRSLDSCDR